MYSYVFNEKQINLMQKIGLHLDFEHLSDDDWVLIEEKVGDYYNLNTLDEDYKPNAEGRICESILDNLP